MKVKGHFARFAGWAADRAGGPTSFVLALGLVVTWAALGPFFHFSEGWQITINSCTTIVTFLMVFLIQNTQNSDTKALQLKLDELIRATRGAHVALLDLEELDESELKYIRRKYDQLAADARRKMRSGGEDTDDPAIDLKDVAG
jgi:low affinity Fe/Cu permease